MEDSQLAEMLNAAMEYERIRVQIYTLGINEGLEELARISNRKLENLHIGFQVFSRVDDPRRWYERSKQIEAQYPIIATLVPKPTSKVYEEHKDAIERLLQEADSKLGPAITR